MGEAQWDGVHGRASEALERLLKILCCCRPQYEDDTVLQSSSYLYVEAQECFDLHGQVNASRKLSLFACLPPFFSPGERALCSAISLHCTDPPCYFDSPD